MPTVHGGVLTELCRVHAVPGAALARISDGEVQSVEFAGATTWDGASVDVTTVFDAASLTKPVFAAAVLRLVELRDLDLDRPLVEYVDDLGLHDERAAQLTPRLILRHASGLPNWRSGRWTSTPGPLRFVDEPGTAFGYSGEGFELLRAAVEVVTGEGAAAVVERLVLNPLGMSNSAMTAGDVPRGRRALGHDEHGNAVHRPDLQGVNAAGSLRTTASDYGRFLASLRTGELFNHEHSVVTLVTSATTISPVLGWGCGIGTLRANDACVWQWGDDPGWKAFAIARRRDGLVILTNSDRGTRVIVPLVLETYAAAAPIFKHIGWHVGDR
jgi:CubicO group peptidase (beta-lactamase class C family)